jgi:hypothetical protein
MVVAAAAGLEMMNNRRISNRAMAVIAKGLDRVIDGRRAKSAAVAVAA